MPLPEGFVPDVPAGFVPDAPAPAPSAPPAAAQIPGWLQAVRAVRQAIPDPFTVAGKGLAVLQTPLKAAFEAAGRADVAAGRKTPEQAASRAQTYSNIPIPMVAAMLTGGASLPAQSLVQMGTTHAMQQGGLEPKSKTQVALAGATPFAAEGLARGVRALGRTATRLVPDLFRRAQTGAQEALGGVQAGLAPTEPTALFKGARAVAQERVPAGQLTAMLDDLDQAIPDDPISPGLKAAREFIARGRSIAGSGDASLGDLLRYRQDLGPMVRQNPQLQAIYKAVLGDLEAGSTTGSRLAVQAIDASRKQHGAALFSELVEKATERGSVAGADVPALNVAKLYKLVQKEQAELAKRLGPESMNRIEQFLVQYRSLPPTHAWTVGNVLINSIAGGAGALGFGPQGLLGAGLVELAKNAFQVGATPPATLAASRAIPALAGGRAAMAPR